MERKKIHSIKGLYLAKNIEDLQKQMKFRLPVSKYTSLALSSLKSDLLVKVSQELLKTAKESEANGDQEKAYVLFFKYCDIAFTLQNSPEYTKNKLYYDSMVSSKRVEDAFDHLKNLTVELKKRYDETQTKEAQIQLNITPVNCVMNLESKLEKEKEVNEKWQSTFLNLTFLIICLDQISKLECENQSLKELLKKSRDQNSKLGQQNSSLQESLDIFGDQSLFKCENQRLTELLNLSQDQNSKLKDKNVCLQESLKIFGDQTLKLERRNQDLQDQNSKLECKSIGLQENQRLKKLLHISQAQNSKLEHKNVGFQKSLKIIGDQTLKFEQKIQDLQDQNSELEHKNEEKQTFFKCENQRLKKLLNTCQDQNSKLAHKNIDLQDSLKIFGHPNAFGLFKCELQRNKKWLKILEDQNSKLEQEKVGLQESLKIFRDQNLKLERRNQDLRDEKMCKICMDQEVSQVFNPCNHTICCNICITSLQKCPICRKNIESSQMIYF